MPPRKDIHKVMIIGSGPIVIGQACEFDYSGTQACKALKELGFEVLLVNSNPATIMTDPETADITYVEPLNLRTLTEIIEKEKPDSLLPNLGGQTGLNLALELSRKGVLEANQVEVIGVNLDAIERGEDRIEFKKAMNRLQVPMPRSEPAFSVEAAESIAADLGYPVVIRPAYTLGGTGGGLVYNVEELQTVVARGIAASMVGQVLVEESVLGWEELEVEVVRDAKNQMITVCFIENVDAMGVHTGDSFCTAPMMTTPASVQKRLQEFAYRIVEDIGVIGGTNVQFAYDPAEDRIAVIEINPRTSRSSALASKATGFPIALISAKLAAGMTLDEIPYWRRGTLDQYTPSGDYVVVKFARWAFEKFKKAEDRLGTQMRAVGEVMSIGRNYREALQKAIRSLEIGRYGLGFARDFNRRPLAELLEMLNHASSERQFILYEALRKGASIEELHRRTWIKAWFLEQMKELVELEQEILASPGVMPGDRLLRQAKLDGFSDKYLGQILGLPEAAFRERRRELGIEQEWDTVPVSGVESAVYYYSTYNGVPRNRVAPAASGDAGKPRRKVMVLGGGPNRIGQGIEFDYCCVHAAFELRERGVETVMVNCNPETVSTDYDTSDRLYFEPLTVEDVLSIYRAEQPDGLIVQFGGQTPLNIAEELAAAGVPILGTSPDMIDLAEDRDRFRRMMDDLGIPMPESEMAADIDQALEAAAKIGYPVMVRPSYVLGGRGMEVVYDDEMLREYVAGAVGVTPDRPLLIDRFLEDAMEVEADALADGEEVFIPAVMEHIEQAGIHSGDSACVLPPINVAAHHLATIEDYTRRVARALKVVGLMNMQYAIHRDKVYMLEANPRASRTVPLVSKVCHLPMARLATRLMLGEKLSDLRPRRRKIAHFGVKEAVLPFNMFPEVDPLLGPEMRSTGEVLGLAESAGLAFFKAEEAANSPLPLEGTVLFTVNRRDQSAGLVDAAAIFHRLGFKLLATEGTGRFLGENGIPTEIVHKMQENRRPNILDAIMNRQARLVVNTPAGKQSQFDDSYIRKSAIKYRVPYITTVAAARAAAHGIEAMRKGRETVKSLQEYARMSDSSASV